MHYKVQLILPATSGAKPRAQLTKRKSFEEKAHETASRLEAPPVEFREFHNDRALESWFL